MSNKTHQAPHCFNIVEKKTIKNIKPGGGQVTIYFTDNSYLCIEGKVPFQHYCSPDDYCYCETSEVEFDNSYYSEAK